MGVFGIFFSCLGLLLTVVRCQALAPCAVGSIAFSVGSTESAATLANLIQCSDGDFAVEWTGKVFVAETIRVNQGTSLSIVAAGPGAIANGNQTTQLFFVDNTSSLHLMDMTLAEGRAVDGGAMYARDSSVAFGGSTNFRANSATTDGGAIFATNSTVSWGGDIAFTANSAGSNGGAISIGSSSEISWDGQTIFDNNTADYGGALAILDESASAWSGNTTFSNNVASFYGGGVTISSFSTGIWSGITTFGGNAALKEGGGIWVFGWCEISWNGTVAFENHTSDRGGAVHVENLATLSWNGTTSFVNNVAYEDGGAVNAQVAYRIFSGGVTTFKNNEALDGDGGALALYGESEDVGSPYVIFSDQTTFDSNRAFGNGGAIYIFEHTDTLNFEGVTFSSNSARAGGAIASIASGSEGWPSEFRGCQFLGNTATETGGAVESAFGQDEYLSSHFENNSAGTLLGFDNLWTRAARSWEYVNTAQHNVESYCNMEYAFK